MRATEIYEKQTGNKQPCNQIAYHEWKIEYVKWLEEQTIKAFISTQLNSTTMEKKIIKILKEYSDCDYNDGDELFTHNDSDLKYIAEDIVKLFAITTESVIPPNSGSLPFPVSILDGLKIDIEFKGGGLIIKKSNDR